MMDQTGASPVAYVFKGTSPSSGTTSTSANLTTPAVNNPILGAWGGGTSQYGIGTIKNFRYYDRVLTEEELVRNRQVDSARYFGALAVTNVVVAVEEGSGITTNNDGDTAPGAYFVEGEYTFSATGGAGLGYRLYTPDGNGGWQAYKSFPEEKTFTYTTGTSPALVKLEWCVRKPFFMIFK